MTPVETIVSVSEYTPVDRRMDVDSIRRRGQREEEVKKAVNSRGDYERIEHCILQLR